MTNESWDSVEADDDVSAQELFVDVLQKQRSMASCSKQRASAAEGKGAEDPRQSLETREFAQFSDKPQPPAT